MDSRDDEQRELVERMRDDAAANGDYEGAAALDRRLAKTERIDELIEASSLGTPEAKAARDSVPDETARRITARTHLIRVIEQALDHYPLINLERGEYDAVAATAAKAVDTAGWVPGELLAAEQARNATLTDTIQAARALVDDWNGNGNSRELSDPCPYVWFQCARELLAALDGPGEEDG